MYLRTTTRRTKTGETVRYIQLAHNQRNERGVPVAKVIYRLGREDLVDRDGLVRLVRSIERFLGVEAGLRAGAPRGFDLVAAPECGGPHVIGELWSALGMDKAIARAAGAGRERCGLERAIFTMVCHLALEPASKLEATRWVGRDVVIAGTPAVTDDQLSRAVDRLPACAERAQESVFSGVAHVLDLEVDTVFFGITSTWKIEADDDLDTDEAPQGPDGRPKVQIGLAVTREGIPVRVWVWPASTSDQAVVEEMEADLTGSGWAGQSPSWTSGSPPRTACGACARPAGTTSPG